MKIAKKMMRKNNKVHWNQKKKIKINQKVQKYLLVIIFAKRDREKSQKDLIEFVVKVWRILIKILKEYMKTL